MTVPSTHAKSVKFSILTGPECVINNLIQNNPSLTKLIKGDEWIEFGGFRIGVNDDNNFVTSSDLQKTNIVVYRDGTYLKGPITSQYGLWDKSLFKSGPMNIKFTRHGVEFGDEWCLGISKNNKLSIS